MAKQVSLSAAGVGIDRADRLRLGWLEHYTVGAAKFEALSSQMIFFTRELFEGTQPHSGWERRAMRETERRGKIYAKYFDIIAPLLPAPVVRLCKMGLHDGVIQEASLKDHELALVVDTTNALSEFRGSLVTLTFRGVRGHPAVSKLVGEWWLYEEAHLSSKAPFSLHVMFNKIDLEIEAEKLAIKSSARLRPWTPTTRICGKGGGS